MRTNLKPFPELPDDGLAIRRLTFAFEAQRQAHLRDPYPSYDERVGHIRSIVAMAMTHREAMKAALDEDFGCHPAAVGDLIEVLGLAARADYTIRYLAEWMKDDTREIDPALWGAATASVRYQPKGVVGNMVPWNFPFDIAFGPLIDMLGAGNRVILKPSELGPACGALIAQMVAETFEPERVTVVLGGIGLAKAFPTLPWNHLLYTGSPAIGREVMRAAAENLVPVTLELGGKSPAIVAPDAVDARSVASLIGTKRLKSGQVCVAPDHVFVPRELVGRFVALARQIFRNETPDYVHSDDNTGIISRRHLNRLQDMVAEARSVGSEVVALGQEAFADNTRRQMPFYLVVEPKAGTALATQEIFGPILPIVPYDDLDAVIAGINADPRPLGLYIYTHDAALAEDILRRTTSGGACVNTALLHGALPSLPFGGSGNSGMGRHHAVEGFREFSNPRGVLVRGTGPDLLDAFNPPYRTLEAIVEGAFVSEP